MAWAYRRICLALSLFVLTFSADVFPDGLVFVLDGDDAALELLQVQVSRSSKAPKVIAQSPAAQITAEIAESAADEVMAVVDPQGKDDVSNIVKKDGLTAMISEVVLVALETVQKALKKGKSNKQAEEAAFEAVKNIVQSEINLLRRQAVQSSHVTAAAAKDKASHGRAEDVSTKASLVDLVEETSSNVQSHAGVVTPSRRTKEAKGPSGSIIAKEGFQAMLSQVVMVALEAAQEAIDAGKSEKEAQKATFDAVKGIVNNEIGAMTDEATTVAGHAAHDAKERASHVAEKKKSAKLSVEDPINDAGAFAGGGSDSSMLLLVAAKKQRRRFVEHAKRNSSGIQVGIVSGAEQAKKTVATPQGHAQHVSWISEEESVQGHEDTRPVEMVNGKVMWPRLGSENSKCNSPAGAHTRLEHEVADQLACQAEARKAGHDFYSFAIPKDGHGDCPANRACCRTTAFCSRVIAGTSWPWQIFMATGNNVSSSQI